MPVDERSRPDLYLRLEEVLGREEATTLMEFASPVGVGRGDHQARSLPPVGSFLTSTGVTVDLATAL
jgi:hypothetical protein